MEEQLAEATNHPRKSLIEEIGLPILILLVMIPFYYLTPLFEHRTDAGICKWGVFTDLRP
jgi:hypothetical protein